MKTYTELTAEQQKAAIDKVMRRDLGAIVSGALQFNDEMNGDNFQATVDQALGEAEKMQTPWFAHEYVRDARYNPGDGHITEDDGLWPVAEMLRSLAMPVCEDALYPEDEVVIEGIA